MVGTHIAHDCIVDNNVIFANHSTLVGHVIIEKMVVGALSAIHQFSRIGEGSMIGGRNLTHGDVPLFCTVIGNRAKLRLNIVGLKRNNISKNEISELRKVYNFSFNNKDLTFQIETQKKCRIEKITFIQLRNLLNLSLKKAADLSCLP